MKKKVCLALLMVFSILIFAGQAILVYRGFNFYRIILFIVFDLILAAYFSFSFKCSFNKVNEIMYKFRYIFLLILFIFSISLKLNFSSIASWENYIGSEKINKNDITVILGKARPIRSDEWLVQTPMYLSQSLNKDFFPVINKNASTDGANALLSGYSPTFDIITIGKPFNWGFLLLGKNYGFSWYWISKLILLFAFSFEMSMILTKRNKLVSLFGAVIILFSSGIQWWLSTGVADLIIFSQIIAVSFYWVLISGKPFKKILATLGIIIGGTGFIFALYPPLQIPLGILTLIIMFYILTEDDRYKAMKKLDYILAFSVVCVLGILIFHYYKLSYKQISLMSSTAYPGMRVAQGGGISVERLLYYFFSWKLPFKNVGAFSNNSEASSFFTLFPFIPFIFLFIKNTIYEKFKLLKYLLYFLVFQILWLFITFPKWFAKATLLSYVEPTRLLIVFGLTCTYILIIYLAAHKDIEYRVSFLKVFLFLNLFLIIFLYKSDINVYLGNVFLMITLTYINAIIYFIYKQKTKVAMVLIGVFIFVSGAVVNPICQGLGSIYNNKLSEEIISLNKSSEGTWLGINNITYGDYLLANGVKSFNCVNYLPDYSKWSKLDKAAEYKDVYNRYAHIVVNLTEDKTKFVLNTADTFILSMNFNDLIANTDIKYIMSADKILSYQKYKEISEIYYDKQSNIYIYEINR